MVEACEPNNVVILITADHGMSFPSDEGKGGHSSAKYSSQKESLFVPAVFIGPGTADLILAGNWSEMDLAPTLLDLMGLCPALSLSEGRVIPVSRCFDLEVDARKVNDVEVRKNGSLVARATGDSRYVFRNLDLGSYSVESGGRVASVHLCGNRFLDLAGGSLRVSDDVAPSIFDRKSRKSVAAILILAINIIGAVLIFRIVRSG